MTVVDVRPEILDFADRDVVEALRYHLRDINVTFRLGERVERVEEHESGTLTTLASGKQIAADAVFYSAGRQGATEALALANAGLESDDRGRIEVGPTLPHGRAAHLGRRRRRSASRAWRRPRPSRGGSPRPTRSASRRARSGDLLPFGIYAIPEISYVGKTEDELTAASIPYESGVAHYRELARGQIMGETHGMLKLLVSPVDGTLLGVHAFGTGATEVVHIGQAVMGLGGTVDYLVDAVFNYPTLAEAYKVAALDAANKLRAVTSTSVSTLVR